MCVLKRRKTGIGQKIFLKATIIFNVCFLSVEKPGSKDSSRSAALTSQLETDVFVPDGRLCL
jgi:hypothetical protein